MPESCATFCKPEKLKGRIIRETELFRSVVSSPWFRYGHCLVMPVEHVETIDELEPRPEVSAAIMSEMGRLATLLDTGFGTSVMQKHQPTQAENGIKVNHLHFHVVPREDEPGLFPVPEPNDFSGLITPTDEEIAAVLQRTR